MKLFTVLTAVLLLASCSIGPGLTISHGKGRVLVASSQSLGHTRSLVSEHPHDIKSYLAQRKATFLQSGRSARSAMHPRDLSASADIVSMTYTVTNLDPYSGEGSFQDVMDPTYPYLELLLTPGQRYRISVEVNVNASAPGHLVGVTQFGDDYDVTVSSDSDTYVDLYLHPAVTPIFLQRPNGPNVSYLPDPVSSQTTISGFSTSVTASPGSKFFYAVDGQLYYFDAVSSRVFRWDDMTMPIDTTNDVVYNGGSTNVTLYCVSPDPTDPTYAWAVGKAGAEYYAYLIDLTTPDTGYPSDPITADLDYDVNAATHTQTPVPTGIAADTIGDVFISFWNHAATAGSIYSGILAYYNGLYAAVIPNTSTWTSTSSLVTDITCAQGKVLALLCPITSTGYSTVGYTGTADVFVANDFLVPWIALPSGVAASFSNPPQPQPATGFALPNKFAAPVFGDWLYISEADPVSSGTTENITAVRSDLSSYQILVNNYGS